MPQEKNSGPEPPGKPDGERENQDRQTLWDGTWDRGSEDSADEPDRAMDIPDGMEVDNWFMEIPNGLDGKGREGIEEKDVEEAGAGMAMPAGLRKNKHVKKRKKKGASYRGRNGPYRYGPGIEGDGRPDEGMKETMPSSEQNRDAFFGDLDMGDAMFRVPAAGSSGMRQKEPGKQESSVHLIKEENADSQREEKPVHPPDGKRPGIGDEEEKAAWTEMEFMGEDAFPIPERQENAKDILPDDWADELLGRFQERPADYMDEASWDYWIRQGPDLSMQEQEMGYLAPPETYYGKNNTRIRTGAQGEPLKGNAAERKGLPEKENKKTVSPDFPASPQMDTGQEDQSYFSEQDRDIGWTGEEEKKLDTRTAFPGLGGSGRDDAGPMFGDIPPKKKKNPVHVGSLDHWTVRFGNGIYDGQELRLWEAFQDPVNKGEPPIEKNKAGTAAPSMSGGNRQSGQQQELEGGKKAAGMAEPSATDRNSQLWEIQELKGDEKNTGVDGNPAPQKKYQPERLSGELANAQKEYEAFMRGDTHTGETDSQEPGGNIQGDFGPIYIKRKNVQDTTSGQWIGGGLNGYGIGEMLGNKAGKVYFRPSERKIWGRNYTKGVYRGPAGSTPPPGGTPPPGSTPPDGAGPDGNESKKSGSFDTPAIMGPVNTNENRIRFFDYAGSTRRPASHMAGMGLRRVALSAKIWVMSAAGTDPTIRGAVITATVAGKYMAVPTGRFLYRFARNRVTYHRLRSFWKSKKIADDYKTVEENLRKVLQDRNEKLAEKKADSNLKFTEKLQVHFKKELTKDEIDKILKPTNYRDFKKLLKLVRGQMKRNGLPFDKKSIKKLLEKDNKTLNAEEKALLRTYQKLSRLEKSFRKVKMPLIKRLKRKSARLSVSFRVVAQRAARNSENNLLQGALFSTMVARRMLKISLRTKRTALRNAKRVMKDAKVVRNTAKVLAKAPKAVPNATIRTGRFVTDRILTGGSALVKHIYKAGTNLSKVIVSAGAKKSAALAGKAGAKAIQLAYNAAAKAVMLGARAVAYVVSLVVSAIATLGTLMGPVLVVLFLVLALIFGLFAIMGLDNEKMEQEQDNRAVAQYVEALIQCHEDYAEKIEELYTDGSYETVTVTYKDEKNEQVYIENPNEYGFLETDNNIKECLCLMSALFDFSMETYALEGASDEVKAEDEEMLQQFLDKVDIDDTVYDGTYQALIRVYLIALFNGSHEMEKRVETTFCTGCVPEYNILGELENYYCPGHRHLYVTVTTYYFDRLFSCGLKKHPDSASEINVVGSSNVEKLWFGLLDAGYTEEAAAGIIGNLMWESGGGPSDVYANAVEGNGEGIGMVQWSFGRKEKFLAFLISRGETWPSDNILLQLEYMLWELENGEWMWTSIGAEYGADCHVSLDTFKNCKDVSDATRYFCANFERCYEKDSHMDTRIRWAENVYRMYHGREQGSYTGDTYSLSESQLRGIARLCQQEQGTVQGAMAEASLMANRFELYGGSFGSGGDGLYNYVRNSGWFANAGYWMDQGGSVDSAILEGVRQVLVQGNRTLPANIDEHDYMGDILYVENNGETFNPYDRSQYIPNVTVIHNAMGAVYTFYCFPSAGSDPFGYTSAA